MSPQDLVYTEQERWRHATDSAAAICHHLRTRSNNTEPTLFIPTTKGANGSLGRRAESRSHYGINSVEVPLRDPNSRHSTLDRHARALRLVQAMEALSETPWIQHQALLDYFNEQDARPSTYPEPNTPQAIVCDQRSSLRILLWYQTLSGIQFLDLPTTVLDSVSPQALETCLRHTTTAHRYGRENSTSLYFPNTHTDQYPVNMRNQSPKALNMNDGQFYNATKHETVLDTRITCEICGIAELRELYSTGKETRCRKCWLSGGRATDVSIDDRPGYLKRSFGSRHSDPMTRRTECVPKSTSTTIPSVPESNELAADMRANARERGVQDHSIVEGPPNPATHAQESAHYVGLSDQSTRRRSSEKDFSNRELRKMPRSYTPMSWHVQGGSAQQQAVKDSSRRYESCAETEQVMGDLQRRLDLMLALTGDIDDAGLRSSSCSSDGRSSATASLRSAHRPSTLTPRPSIPNSSSVGRPAQPVSQYSENASREQDRQEPRFTLPVRFRTFLKSLKGGHDPGEQSGPSTETNSSNSRNSSKQNHGQGSTTSQGKQKRPSDVVASDGNEERDDSDDGKDRGKRPRRGSEPEASGCQKRFPCPYRVGSPTSYMHHRSTYSYMCKLQTHLEGPHGLYTCISCIMSFESAPQLKQHQHHKSCTRSSCRRTIPVGYLRTGPCDCILSAEAQWLGLYHIIHPTHDVPVILRNGPTTFPLMADECCVSADEQRNAQTFTTPSNRAQPSPMIFNLDLPSHNATQDETLGPDIFMNNDFEDLTGIDIEWPNDIPLQAPMPSTSTFIRDTPRSGGEERSVTRGLDVPYLESVSTHGNLPTSSTDLSSSGASSANVCAHDNELNTMRKQIDKLGRRLGRQLASTYDPVTKDDSCVRCRSLEKDLESARRMLKYVFSKLQTADPEEAAAGGFLADVVDGVIGARKT